MWATLPSVTSSTCSAHGSKPPSAVGRHWATAGTAVGLRRQHPEPRQAAPGPSIQVPMSPDPRSHISNGGMCWVASSCSSRTNASMS